MKNISRFLWILAWLFSCSPTTKNPQEVLIAYDNFDNFTRYKIDLRLLIDSTYIFSCNSIEINHEKHEIFRGRYYLKLDTIYFHPFEFAYTGSDKAILKGNFIEFLNGKYPLKIRLRKTTLNSIVTYDTTNYSDYAFFNHNSEYYGVFSNKARSVDLDNNELKSVDSLLKICLKENFINRDLKDYYKQCISVIDSSRTKVVWINLLCKGGIRDESYQYKVSRVADGGDCYLDLKINIDTLRYFDLHVNGDA